MLAELRRARYGYLLAVHLLLLCAAGRTPTEIAAMLFCSRSSVYRVVNAYRAGSLRWAEEDEDGRRPPGRLTGLAPALTRSLLAILKATPRACWWCRTRWSCATVALELQVRRGVVVSAETVRRWLHALGWEWKRAKLVAKDEDPQRVEKLAWIRYAFESTTPRFTTRRRWCSGWRLIPASSCSICPPPAPKPTPSNGPLAMSMTNGPVIIHASECGIWSKTSNRLSQLMAPGRMSSPPSTTPRR